MDYAARTLGINVEIIGVKDQSELADAFDRMGARGVAGVALVPDPVFTANARTIAELARIHELPVVGTDTIFVPAGELLHSQKIIWLWHDVLHGMWTKS